MQIEKIKKLNSGKYKLELDDKSKVITYDEVILKNNLLFDKKIDSDVLNQLTIDTDYYDIYYKCVQYIGKRLRSEKEMKAYLNKYTKDEMVLSNILSDLKKIGLIDDVRFARAYASDRFYLSNDGPSKIRDDLIIHDVLNEVVEEVLSHISREDVMEKLTRLIDKKIRLNHKDSNYVLRQKINRDFVSLGYSTEMINEYFMEHPTSDNASLQKEFDRLYRKMKTVDDAGFLKLRQKLFQKGYSLSEIDKLIDEKKVF